MQYADCSTGKYGAKYDAVQKISFKNAKIATEGPDLNEIPNANTLVVWKVFQLFSKNRFVFLNCHL